jgi:hypothetical protein
MVKLTTPGFRKKWYLRSELPSQNHDDGCSVFTYHFFRVFTCTELGVQERSGPMGIQFMRRKVKTQDRNVRV